MKRLILLLALLGLATPAWAHPHLWIQTVVRVTAKDGHFTHFEIEWRFDPYASEIEIPLIDEDKNGKLSAKEVSLLGKDMMDEMKKYGFMTWLNVGGADIRPPKLPTFNARIDDPASFTLPDWDRNATDNQGSSNNLPMPQSKTVQPDPKQNKPRNLVYVMRFELPKPVKAFTVTSLDPDDFVRLEANKDAVPAGCKLSKSATYKAEYIRGYPVWADQLSCQLP